MLLKPLFLALFALSISFHAGCSGVTPTKGPSAKSRGVDHDYIIGTFRLDHASHHSTCPQMIEHEYVVNTPPLSFIPHSAIKHDGETCKGAVLKLTVEIDVEGLYRYRGVEDARRDCGFFSFPKGTEFLFTALGDHYMLVWIEDNNVTRFCSYIKI